MVKDVPEGHLCCGSAGTYNILQPALAERLRDRKVANIERLEPDVIAAGNIGCITQIAAGTAIPVVHTVELLDWATGGPVPEGLRRSERGLRQLMAEAATVTQTSRENCHGEEWRRSGNTKVKTAKRAACAQAEGESETPGQEVRPQGQGRQSQSQKPAAKKTAPRQTPRRSPDYKILLMGASYGSLLASKLLFGGHSIHLVCLPAEADLINAEGFKVSLPVRGRKEPVLLEFAQAAGQGDGRRRGRRQSEGLRSRSASACRSRNTARPACANCSTRSANRACPACRS